MTFEELCSKIIDISNWDEQFYSDFQKKLKVARPIIKLSKKQRTKSFDLEWVEMIEDSIVSLDNIVRNPRKPTSIININKFVKTIPSPF